MRPILWLVLILQLSVWAAYGQSAEPLTPELLKALPEKSEHGLVPVLDVEWSPPLNDQFSLLVKFHTARWHTYLYNVFGDYGYGCPYRIVLTDLDWEPVYQVLNVRPANHTIPPPNLWINADRNRILGRRFWRNSDWTCPATEEYPPKPVTLLEGEYLLHLVATARLESEPPFQDSPRGIARDQKIWRTRKLDRFICRSKPISIQIGEDGRVRRPSPVVLDQGSARLTSMTDGPDLLIQALWITESKYEATNPGLRGIDIDGLIRFKRPTEGDLLRSISDNSLYGKSDAPGPDGFRLLPKDAILGFERKCLKALDPGEYEISVEFPELFRHPEANPASIKKKIKIRIDGEGNPVVE